MSDAPRYATLHDYLRVLRQQRVLVVLAAIMFAGAAFGLSSRQDPVYRAEAAVAFSDPLQDLDIFGTPTQLRGDAASRAFENARLVTSPAVVSAARRALVSGLPVSELQSKLTSRVEVRTNYLIVRGDDRSAEFAARLVNADARALAASVTRSQRSRIQSLIKQEQRRRRRFDPVTDLTNRQIVTDRIARLQGLLNFARPAQITRSATTPANPISPRPVRNTLLGLLLGLTLGIVAAFIRDSLDRRLRGAREIQEQLKLPLLGHVSSDAMGRPGVVSNGRGGLAEPDVEAFRILRTNLEFLDVDHPPRVVVITSALPEEGKSTVAASLACAQAVAGRSTLLVECDMRRPALAGRLGLERGPGLAEYLSGTAGPQEILQTITLPSPDAGNGNGSAPQDEGDEAEPGARLVCITAGGPAPRPAEMLGSERFRSFLGQVRDAYDVVLLDATPLLSVVDTLELVPWVDGILVCVRAARTTRDQARAAKAALDHFPARPTGLVVTDIRPGADEDYGFYSYAYTYGEK